MRRTFLGLVLRTLMVMLVSTSALLSAPLKWPIKPFDRPHIIRATFGEPRGYEKRGPPGQSRKDFLLGHLDSQGRLSTVFKRNIHQGVDIIARRGTPVYAISNGIAQVSVPNESVRVGPFEYVHLTKMVKDGAKIKAFKTVLGYVRPREQHVHLTMYDHSKAGKPINPLSTRGFVGYYDHQNPVINGLMVLDSYTGQDHQPGTGGSVEIFVNAYDKVTIGETFGGEPRKVGLYQLDYVLLDNVNNVVASEESWKFDRLPPVNEMRMVYYPLSERIRFLLGSRQPDIVNFWYRLSQYQPITLEAGKTYRIYVWAWDAFGNLDKHTFNIDG